ncbi:hypothetical protein EC82524_3553B, partial [Escherichia coli 8.2524]
FKITTG